MTKPAIEFQSVQAKFETALLAVLKENQRSQGDLPRETADPAIAAFENGIAWLFNHPESLSRGNYKAMLALGKQLFGEPLYLASSDHWMRVSVPRQVSAIKTRVKTAEAKRTWLEWSIQALRLSVRNGDGVSPLPDIYGNRPQLESAIDQLIALNLPQLKALSPRWIPILTPRCLVSWGAHVQARQLELGTTEVRAHRKLPRI